MTTRLVERDGELNALLAALAAAADGVGSVVLVFGEAGIGKTSLIRSFVRSAAGRCRVLHGACDDLITPRTFGPLRDVAMSARGGPLANALATGDRDQILSGVLTELVDHQQPTALVVEDVHWADDATVDVLGYVTRRIVDLPAVLVVSYRDDEIHRGHAAHRLLGGLSGLGSESVHRLPLRRLSRAGVAELAGRTTSGTEPLFQLTGGNPFFVSEVLATAPGDVPLTVVDAVLARVHRMDAATQSALRQLSVVPTSVDLSLARTLIDDLTVLSEAERRGVLEVRPQAIAFRHELGRRAVEGSLVATERMGLNGRVLAQLIGRDEPDLPRIIHHAAESGDDAVVIERAPAAAQQAVQAGAPAQAIGYYDQVLARSHLLDDTAIARICQALCLVLFTVGRMPAALEVGRRAVALRERIGEPGALGEALCALAPIHWALTQPRESTATAARAVSLLRADGRSPRLLFALMYQGMLLSSTGEYADMVPVADETLAMAREMDVPDLRAMASTLHGRARLLLGDHDGFDEIEDGLRAVIAAPNHGFAMLTYAIMVQDLWEVGRFAEIERYLREGFAYARDRKFDFYVDVLIAHELRLRMLRGDWAPVEAGLRELVGERGAAEGRPVRHALPQLARLGSRVRADDAAELLDWAIDYAARADSPYEVVQAGFAELEHAWLAGRPELADAAIDRLTALTATPGLERHRGELLRWCRRLGRPADVFTGCPEEFAAGIRGDWRAAADAWERLGAPYEQALELLDSKDPTATLDALAILRDLGARAAAQIAQRRLRDLGVTQLPRGPQSATRANPAGLTDRQVEILRLVAAGRTNAEIAAELVVSVRTVDHHVSAVLQKLGLTSRRGAARVATDLGIQE